MKLTFAQKFREHYNVENMYDCRKLYNRELYYYNKHNKTCSWEDSLEIKDPEKRAKSKLLKSKSNHLVTRKLHCGYNGKIHNIHHCFGDVVESFVIMNKQDHIELHKKFGNYNENCLLSNEQVKEFIMNHEHILVEDGVITEDTMKKESKFEK